jgi:hypothetical protein
VDWLDLKDRIPELQTLLNEVSDRLVGSLQEAINGVQVTITVNITAKPVKPAKAE